MNSELLKILKDTPGRPVSGEILSRKLGVSRAAVSKAVQKLADGGYVFRSKPRVGYELVSSPDRMYPCEIEPFLKTKWLGRNILYFTELESTNTYAKTLAMTGFDNGTVIVAEKQTLGRGRRGRRWQDSEGKNLAFSILLRPELEAQNVAQITLLSAQAVLEAFREGVGADVQVKWPNDIVSDGRKLVGILTEMGCQEGQIDYLVVGIGVNVNARIQEYPEELQSVVTSLREVLGKAVDRRQVLAEILNRFEPLYQRFLVEKSIAFFLKDYERYCVNLGRRQTLLQNGNAFAGMGKGVDEHGRLLIEMENGAIREVLSGEVSVRGIYPGGLPER